MKDEYKKLWNDHGATLINPHDYVKEGAFYQHRRKFVREFKDDFHPAEKVERLRELAAMAGMQ